MSILRFLMLLSLAAWLGGIFYFALVVAPAAFSVLPTRHLAGLMVTRALTALHSVGLAAGLTFLAASLTYFYFTTGSARAFALRHVLVVAMLGLTLYAQFRVMPRMAALRTEMVEIDRVPADDPRRIAFNRLHGWSTTLEAGVFLLGLGVLASLARRMG